MFVQAYTRADGTEVKAHYHSKNGGIITGMTANLTGIDKEFDRPLNIQIKGIDTNIPNLGNYFYYKNLNNKFENEVGDFLRQNTNAPKLYSNDIRHQYVSALYARNLGEGQAKWLGDLKIIYMVTLTFDVPFLHHKKFHILKLKIYIQE